MLKRALIVLGAVVVAGMFFGTRMVLRDLDIAELRLAFEDEVNNASFINSGVHGFGEAAEAAANETTEQALERAFGGRLDAIVAERDRLLELKHVRMLGTWTVAVKTAQFVPRTFAVYIPLSPSRLRVTR